VYCWGFDSFGALGVGDVGRRSEEVREPRRVLGGHKFREISVAFGASCAIEITGRLYCWGSVYGAPQPDRCSVGMGEFRSTSECAQSPQPVMQDRRFRSIFVSNLHYCAIDVAGVAVCWGANSVGQLGNGTTTFTERAMVVGRLPTKSEQRRSRIDSTIRAIKHFGLVPAVLFIVLGLAIYWLVRRRR
jgi:alpha-tubulin suppressor-like RCC1 family protein